MIGKARQVKVYETTDGKKFDSKSEADDWQCEINAKAWYQKNGNSMYGDGRVTYEDLVEWLDEHGETLDKLRGLI